MKLLKFFSNMVLHCFYSAYMYIKNIGCLLLWWHISIGHHAFTQVQMCSVALWSLRSVQKS